MEYCPFCSGALSKPVNICPHCKKSLDMEMYQAVYEPGETSQLNRKARRSMWFKENSRFIFPLIFLLVGLILGSTGMFGYAAFHFQNRESELNTDIDQLKLQITQIRKSTGVTSDSLQLTIERQDTVVQILAEQNKLLRQIITFTRRMARNSNLTPKTAAEADYFKRNFRYLNRQYEAQQKKLAKTFLTPENNYDLKTIPDLLQE